MVYNIGAAYPPFCKFNILDFPLCAHVLKRCIDPDGLALFPPPTPVNRKPRETILETFRYRKNADASVSHRF